MNDRILLINSKDRQSGTSSNYSYQITDNYFMNNVHDIELLDVSIPITFYNISAYLGNSTLVCNEGLGNTTVTITDGNYDVNSFVTELQTRLNATMTLVYAVTYNSNTNKLTVSTTGPFSLIFGSTTQQNLAYVMGFEVSTTYNSTLNAITSVNCVDFQPIKQLLIQVIEFGDLPVENLQYNFNKASFVVPVTVNRFDIQRYTDNTFYSQCIRNNKLRFNSITVKLMDQNFKLIDLNAINWFLICRISY